MIHGIEYFALWRHILQLHLFDFYTYIMIIKNFILHIPEIFNPVHLLFCIVHLLDMLQ